MRWECRHCFLGIPTCITACAWRTCRDVCRGRKLAVSFEVGGGENVPSLNIPGACAMHNFTYPVKGPWVGLSHYEMDCLPMGRDFNSVKWTCIEYIYIYIYILELFTSLNPAYHVVHITDRCMASLLEVISESVVTNSPTPDLASGQGAGLLVTRDCEWYVLTDYWPSQ